MNTFEDEDFPPADRLVYWLGAQVHNRTGHLAELRYPDRVSQGSLIASGYAPTEESRRIFRQVAFLFAIFHAGKSEPVYGVGNVGLALRRIGGPSGRGPADPGAQRLADRVFSSRDIPWQHLQSLVRRSRNDETLPPSWGQLVDDLSVWDKSVRVRWGRSFYTPYN